MEKRSQLTIDFLQNLEDAEKKVVRAKKTKNIRYPIEVPPSERISTTPVIPNAERWMAAEQRTRGKRTLGTLTDEVGSRSNGPDLRSKRSQLQNSYTEQDIVVLEGLDAVRKRPSMYIGSIDRQGYHHLLWEIIDNAVDEAINGYASTITVTLHSDQKSVTVEDDGRGIPVGIMPKYGKSALEVILTTLHAGGKFSSETYLHSGGLHGVGSSVVNALSSELRVQVQRDGKRWEQCYSQGNPTTDLILKGKSSKTGTLIFFQPDSKIFGAEMQFDWLFIVERLKARAYLHKSLRFLLHNEADQSRQIFFFEGGIKDYLTDWMEEHREIALHSPLYLEKDNPAKSERFEFALAFTESSEEWMRSYVNGIPTPQGGSHEQGFRLGLVKGVRAFLETHPLVPKGLSLLAEDIREGSFCILSCYLKEPQFQGQTKERLNHPSVTADLDLTVRGFIETWLHQNPNAAEKIALRMIQAARAREAARAAHQAVSRKSTVHARVLLPGKLSDCSSSLPKDCELFIVEGDSAGGSAKQGRDRKTQAILPLRGKILNTEQAPNDKLLANKELQDIVAALGCGFGKDFDESRLRYHRIFLLMDADSDGHHIATLLLTFFYRHLPKLIDNRHIYLAQPPLYRIDIGKETHWILDDHEKEQLLARFPKHKKPEIQRFKGLGEMMPAQLWATTLDPKRRTALRVTVVNPLQTDRVMNELMGKDPSARFRFIMEKAKEAKALDI